MKVPIPLRSTAPRTLTFVVAILTASLVPIRAKTVHLPAGSSDGLAAALAEAGPGGKVILEAGLHTESAGVTVSFRVDIFGKPGAILETSTSPDPDFPINVEAAIHLKNAAHATVQGIWFRPPSGTGSCAVVVEDSPHVEIIQNRVTDYQFGVLVHHGDHSVISDNRIRVSNAWSLDPSDPDFLIDTEGVVIINGEHVRITGNHVSGGFDGIWMCSRKGQCTENKLVYNYIGLLLCRVAAGTFTISGTDAEAIEPGTEWILNRNAAIHNYWGIQATDGSHDNQLLDNNSSDNYIYDCEITGDTLRYGYLVPASYNNTVIQGGKSPLIVKDCGPNNKVLGNIVLIDTSVDICY